MFPHPDTVCLLSAFDYQQRLREAAKERLAASAQTDERSLSLLAEAAHRVAATWLRGLLPRPRGADRVRLPRPQTTS